MAARRQAWLVFGDQRYAIFLTILPLLFAALALVTPATPGWEPPTRTATARRACRASDAADPGGGLHWHGAVDPRPGQRGQHLPPRAISGLSTSAYLGAKSWCSACSRPCKPRSSPPSSCSARARRTRGRRAGQRHRRVVCDRRDHGYCLGDRGLVLSAVARYKQLLLPIVVLVVLLSLVFSGGMFPLAARDGFEQVSWLFPSRWGFAAQASTIDLQSIDLLAEHDALWATRPGSGCSTWRCCSSSRW
ncbi:putative transmembrane ATP-binding protein ABC transporter [Mycobacterium xenopi 3993]|nr:putative transmembrane ATP-binding protein ABC transporter [Mycobacterium xenopi 3993]